MLAALVLHVATKLSLDSGRTHALGACKIGDVRTIFFLMKNDYPEMVSFMRQFGVDFRLNVYEITVGFKQGLSELIEDDEKAGRDVLKAMFMGTRRDDPDGKLQPTFSPTDPSWPPLCRVNPILEFNYHDIWRFLRIYSLPYCSLYDRGFTSIGTIDDTTTNELLWDTRLRRYVHPWILSDGKYERIGRGCRRFFAKRHTLASFLDYPVELLNDITKNLELDDLMRLVLAGNTRLLSKLHNGGVTEVRHTEREKKGTKTDFASSLRFFGQLQSISCAHNIQSPLKLFQTADIQNIYMNLPSTLTSLSIESSPGADILNIPENLSLPHLRHLSTGMHRITDVAKLVNPRLETLVLKSIHLPDQLNPIFATLDSLKTLSVHPATSPTPLMIPSTVQSLMVDNFSDVCPSIKHLPDSITSFVLLGPSRYVVLPPLPSSITRLGITEPSQMLNGHVLPNLETLQIGSNRTTDFTLTWDSLSKDMPHLDVSSIVDAFSASSLTSLVATDIGLKLCDEDGTSTSWPSGLTDMQFNLKIPRGNSDLKRLPSRLTRLYLSIPCVNHEKCESPSDTLGSQHLDFSLLPRFLTSLRLIHAHFSTGFFPHLPNTLRTLVLVPAPGGRDWLHSALSSPIDQPDAFLLLPPSLTELLIGQVGAFAPALKYLTTAVPNLNRLELWRDNSIEDSHLHLLPRHLQTLILPVNTQTFCERLADLPRSLTAILLPNANVQKQPSDEQLEDLPLGIHKLAIGKRCWTQVEPTSLFAWPKRAPPCPSITHSTV